MPVEGATQAPILKMYEKFFQFKEPPFNLTPDPRFFFFSKKHEEAFEHVLYGVEHRKGFIVITGEVGTGKTTLCRLLMNRLEESGKIRTALIFNPSLTTVELLQAIAQDFGLEVQSRSKGELVNAINRFLLNELSRGGNAVLIIDEAQNLGIDCMEEIRMLSNLETDKEKLLQILLLGQPELRDQLMHRELRQFNQRVTLRYHIEALDLEESISYIHYRLKVAGGEDRVLFTPTAINRIHHASGGIPRLINAISDKALLAAYASRVPIVNQNCVARSVAELSIGQTKSPTSHERNRSEKSSRPRQRNAEVWMAMIGLVLVLSVAFLWSQDRLGDLLAYFEGPSESLSERAFQENTLVESIEDSSLSGGGLKGVVGLASPAVDVIEETEGGFDEKGIYRVTDPADTGAAAHLTLLKLWGVRLDEDFSVKKVNRKAMTRIYDRDSFKTFRFRPDLQRLQRFDTPCILVGHWGNEGAQTYVVLSKMTRTEAVVLDPLQGERVLSIDQLKASWGERAVMIWRGLPGIKLPVRWNSDKIMIRNLQKALKKKGIYNAMIDGVMGPMTRSAIRRLQARSGLNPDGIFGVESYLILSKSLIEGGFPTLQGDQT